MNLRTTPCTRDFYVKLFQIKNSVKNSNLASVGLLSTTLKLKLWIWGRCHVPEIFMPNYFRSKLLWKIQILHRSAYWAPCWSLSYEFEDDAVFPRFLCRLMQALRTEVFLGWFLLIILSFFPFFPLPTIIGRKIVGNARTWIIA